MLLYMVISDAYSTPCYTNNIVDQLHQKVAISTLCAHLYMKALSIFARPGSLDAWLLHLLILP
jgi:hypothetical protein